MIKIRSGLKYIVFALIILSLTEQAQAKGTVSFTFDDGNYSMDTIYNIFQPRGIVATVFLVSNEPTGINQNSSFLSTITGGGWEVGCHGATHSSFVTLSEDYINTNYSGCKDYYNNLGYYVNSFAYPYSAYNSTSLKYLNKYFPLFRSPQTNITLDNRSITNAGLYGEFTFHDMDTNWTDTQEIKNQINYSISNNSWLVLLGHKFNSTGWSLDGIGTYGQINMTDIADYVQQKIASNELNENTISGSWYERKDVSSYFSARKTLYGTVNGSYSLRQDTLKNIILNVSGKNFTNLITNANFENWTDVNTLNNWTKDVNIISVNRSSDSLYGTYSAYVNANSSKPTYQRDITQYVNISSNASFQFRANLKSVSNTTTVGVNLFYYNDSSDTGVSDYVSITISNTSWASGQLSKTTTYNTTKILIQIYPETISGVNASYLIDGASLAVGVLPDKYIEGNETTGIVTVDINGTIYQTNSLFDGQSQEFKLSDANNTYNLINISSSGNGISIINLSGDRVFATRYGIIEYANNKYNISEYSDSTVIEILSQGNYSLDLKTEINYSVRDGVTANIDNSTISSSGSGVNVKYSVWNTTGDYRKVFTLSSSASVTAGDFPANTWIKIDSNGIEYNNYLSNGTGYISFTYTGGAAQLEASLTESASIPIGWNKLENDVPGYWGTWSSVIAVAIIISIIGILFIIIKSDTIMDLQLLVAAGFVLAVLITLFIIIPVIGYNINSIYAGMVK